MNILKPDSPVMEFLRTVTNLIIVDLLCVLCCIPVITFGAAVSAKYYVSMKIIRGEGSGVVGPFFKSFAQNFKQATKVWLILLVAIFLIVFDWRWILYSGWNSTAFIYKFGVIFFSVAVTLMTLAIFPTIARYKMKTTELFKAALLFIMIKLIPLLLITLLIVGSVIACLWYAQWFPLVYAFTSTAITYYLSILCIKQFDKLEKAQEEKLKALKESVEYDPETDAIGNISLAGEKKNLKQLEGGLNEDDAKVADKSGNRFTRYIKTEKEKLKDLSFKQKLIYFAQYYLPSTVLVILVIGAAVWYGTDVYKSKMRVLGGGVINGYPTEAGIEYATKGFLEWGGYGKNRTSRLLAAEDLYFSDESEYEEKYLDVAFRAQIITGTFDYMIMREDAVYTYSTPDYFQDLSLLVDMDNFTEDDFYYYVETEAEKAKKGKGVSIDDLLGRGAKDSDNPIPIALKLTEEAKQNLGLDDGHDYYIAFAYAFSAKENNNYMKFIEYLFGKC